MDTNELKPCGRALLPLNPLNASRNVLLAAEPMILLYFFLWRKAGISGIQRRDIP
jgi:hypothetical protein